MPRFALLLGLLAGCAIPPIGHAAEPGTPYAFDAAKSQLYVQVFKDATTMGASLSHDHVVVATGWSGSATLSAADPTSCAVDIVVPVAGLRPDRPEMRKKVGYDVMLTDAQQAQVTEHMLGADQLDAGRFSEIRFRATSCSGAIATGTAAVARTVSGQLTIHGVAKAVQIPLQVAFEGATLHATGAFRATQPDFGLVPFTALLGQLKNQPGLIFSFDVVAVAR